jgi:hypothetical protein
MGKSYGQVTNHRGQIWTGLGAPEIPLITALVDFRERHAAELRHDPQTAGGTATENR